MLIIISQPIDFVHNENHNLERLIIITLIIVIMIIIVVVIINSSRVSLAIVRFDLEYASNRQQAVPFIIIL